MTNEPKIEGVYYGSINAMIAEVAACDMGPHWFRVHRYKYAVKIIADQEFATDYYTNIKDARSEARRQAKFYGVPAYGV